MATSYSEFKKKTDELREVISELNSLDITVGELPDKMPTIHDLEYLRNLLGYCKATNQPAGSKS